MRSVLLCTSLALVSLSLHAANPFAESLISIRVVDETAVPIADATISAACYTNHTMVKGRTDTIGLFSYTDRIAGGLSCYVHKPGYYDTHGEIWQGPTTLTEQPPTNLTVVLKKIIAPSALVFKTVSGLFLPSLNEPVAFDFAAADWVTPHGRGINADVWMTASYRQSSRMDYDISVALTFSNRLDGIQSFTAPRSEELYVASDLMPPQQAPVFGYTNFFLAFNNMRPNTPGNQSVVPNRNHIFRVRTRTNEANVIVSANVGWTVGDIQVGVGKKGKVGPMFGYYFNPDPTSRSLEPLDADNSKYR